MGRRYLLISAFMVVHFGTVGIRAKAQDGPPVELGVGFGQDFGGIGAQLGLLPLRQLCIFGGAGILPGSQLGFNAGVQIIPVAAWKDALFACAMYGYHTVLNDQGNQAAGAAYQLVGTKSESDLDRRLFIGATVGLGTRIGASGGTNHWKLAVLMPLRSGEAQKVADDLDLLPITISVGYHFELN